MSNRFKIKQKKLAYQGFCKKCGNLYGVMFSYSENKVHSSFSFGCACYLDVDYPQFNKNDFEEFMHNNCYGVIMDRLK